MKLFLFDFDGTALGGHTPYFRFPSDFVGFLDNLHHQGIAWGTNSGWSIAGQIEVIRSSGVRSDPLLLVGDTGREIGIYEGGELVRDSVFAAEIRQKDELFRKRNGQTVRRFLRELLELGLENTYEFDWHQRNSLHFCGREEHLDRTWELVMPLLESGEFYLISEPARDRWFTLVPDYMNKGAPLRYLHKKLNLSPRDIAVAGDWINDMAMFDPALAKHMVCPANAGDEVKRQVRKNGGIVAQKEYSWGVVEGVTQTISRWRRTT